MYFNFFDLKISLYMFDFGHESSDFQSSWALVNDGSCSFHCSGVILGHYGFGSACLTSCVVCKCIKFIEYMCGQTLTFIQWNCCTSQLFYMAFLHRLSRPPPRIVLHSVRCQLFAFYLVPDGSRVSLTGRHTAYSPTIGRRGLLTGCAESSCVCRYANKNPNTITNCAHDEVA